MGTKYNPNLFVLGPRKLKSYFYSFYSGGHNRVASTLEAKNMSENSWKVYRVHHESWIISDGDELEIMIQATLFPGRQFSNSNFIFQLGISHTALETLETHAPRLVSGCWTLMALVLEIGCKEVYDAVPKVFL